MKQDIISFRTFAMPRDVYNWVNSNYSQEYINNLNDTLRRDTALMEYKGGAYKAMNRCLRNGYADSDACDIAGLQSFLNQCCLPEDIVVYRFVSWKELLFLWDKGALGRSFHYPSFLSTTMLPDSYSMEDIKKSRYKIRLYVPKDAPATFLPEINPDKPEFEVLLAHNLMIKQVGYYELLISGRSNQEGVRGHYIEALGIIIQNKMLNRNIKKWKSTFV